MDQARIAQRFTDHFQIEYAGARRGIDVDTRAIAIQNSSKKTRKPLGDASSNASFEFVNDGVVLLNK
jgi:hypothetical protein